MNDDAIQHEDLAVTRYSIEHRLESAEKGKCLLRPSRVALLQIRVLRLDIFRVVGGLTLRALVIEQMKDVNHFGNAQPEFVERVLQGEQCPSGHDPVQVAHIIVHDEDFFPVFFTDAVFHDMQKETGQDHQEHLNWRL